MANPITLRAVQFILWVLLLWGFVVRLHGIVELKQGLSHDESVTYLCAAGTEGDYEEQIRSLVNRPITTSDIQRFYDRPALSLGKVARDLAQHDIHPPLYFWCLHIFHVLWGLGIYSGALFNLFIGTCLLWVVHKLALRVLRDQTLALVAVVLWYLSPTVVQIDLEARHYQLLALFSIASILLVHDLLAGRGGVWHWIAFTLINIGGSLTHYYYAFILVPGVLYLLFAKSIRSSRTRLIISLALSVAVFLVCFPAFFDFLVQYAASEKDPAKVIGMTDRVRSFTYAALAFFADAHLLRYVYLILCVLLVGAVALAGKRIKGAVFGSGAPEQSFFWVASTWMLAFTGGLYLMGVSHPHAVGEQYLSYFWPLLAIVLVELIRKVIATPFATAIIAVHIAQLALFLPGSVSGSEYIPNAIPLDWYGKIENYDLLVMDDPRRSSLPRVARHLPADMPLYVMVHEQLEVVKASRVAFLHSDWKENRSTMQFVDRMIAQGYVAGPVEKYGHFELHTFVR